MQLSHWQGKFGDDYILRNQVTNETTSKKIETWRQLLSRIDAKSILEVGANVGQNLRAIKELTSADLYAVEPNAAARARLIADGVIRAERLRSSPAQAIDFPDGVADLVFTSGVLIHISPDDLLRACKEIHRCASKWVGCIEYFSDKPVTIPYRGHDDLLFKRDFGDFWLSHFPDLKLVDCGFFWKRATGLDNLNWWIFEKK